MNIAVLTAGGIGSRTHQDLPKQFLTVENLVWKFMDKVQKSPWMKNIVDILTVILRGLDIMKPKELVRR